MSSRESENAHPTPRRTGPDAYPSGTPPYGTPGFPGGDRTGAGTAGGSAPEGDDESPKTETTVTTRVRINIPGSRPIPPVVVRSAVKNEDGPGEDAPAPAPAEPAGPRHRSAAPSSPVLGVMDGGGARAATPPNLPPEWQIPPATSESESTGAWFRPRQKKAADAPAPVAASAPVGAPGAQATAAQPAQAAPDAGPRRNGTRPNGSRPDAGRPNGRPVPAQAQAPAPRPTGAPASPYGTGPELPAEEAGVYADAPADPFAPGPAADPFAPGAGAPGRAPQGPGRPLPGGPEDTSVDGFAPIRDDAPPAAIPGVPGGAGAPNGAPQPGLFASAPAGADPFAAQRPPAAGPNGTPPPAGLFPGAPLRQGEPGGPGAGGGPGGPGGAFDAAPADPFRAAPGLPQYDGPGTGVPAPGPAPVPTPAPAPQPAAPKPASGTAKRKPSAAKKLVKLGTYAVIGVLFLGAAAYGTGLMMNQSDIPKGTVVLGTDIGGSNRDQAIRQLDETVGKAGQQPVKLKVGEQTLDLDPTAAGLSFDTTATVDKLTQHSYNPADVLKSLKGDEKAVPPEVKVDRAKLKAALDALATGSGQGLQEGYVKFGDNGEVVVVPGKAGQAVDSASAVELVDAAYRDRAAGRTDQPVALSVTAAQPKNSPQALQGAADTLGKSAVNGIVRIQAGAKKWDFTPKIAAKTLTLVPDANGKIVPKWDLDALNGQLAGAFDKVKMKKNGQLVQITPQDVADAVTSVLDKTGERDRTVKFTV
ncbi:peptidoglycan binding domain-containing protein [Streptomyces sp. BE303]|uniref:peptidoglycan binding domain-containing protein n=1 Tax=Streptomyces sp. BE303 TaxID=3002528 RepID=UPI002E761AB4|nr:peptidoglycan binding domain-containing protein [Streptomyces sp. BE303]MED7949985.1 peptidoglycan binding domain-containing protein [Streptomyces sp. BE303]